MLRVLAFVCMLQTLRVHARNLFGSREDTGIQLVDAGDGDDAREQTPVTKEGIRNIFAKLAAHEKRFETLVSTMHEEDQKIRDAISHAQIATPGTASSTATPDATGEAPAAELVASKVGREKFVAGLKAVTQAKDGVLAWYEGNAALLEKAPIRPPDEDKPLIAKMAKTIHGGFSDDEEQKFVISLLGSSMTAGHDNFENHTFAAVLQRALQPAWDSMGIKFEVRNLGIGGRNPNPWPLCMKQMVGDDTDVVIWESEFWNFEAGYAKTIPIQKEGADVEQAGLEILLRNVFRLPKQPAIHFLKMDPNSRHDVLSWIDQWFDSGKPLSPYASFPINGFDSFGEPFNNLIARAKKKGTRTKAPPSNTYLFKDGQRTFTEEPGECPEEDIKNVKKCPVDPYKPDGYHGLPKFLLKDDPANHPNWMQWYHENNLGALFANWHPAPLAHEVIGNQLAYYQLSVMEKALRLLIGAEDISPSSAFGKNVRKDAASQHLPTNILCNDMVCNPNFAQKCAITNLPKSAGPDIGDWMVNDTAGSPWTSEFADMALRCNYFSPYLNDSYWDLDEEHNNGRGFMRARVCTRGDQNRGFKGYPGNAPLSLVFTDMASCKIWLGESTHGAGQKPGLLAHWESELSFKVNGEPCNEHCKVHSQGGSYKYAQMVEIDARGVLGKKCRKVPVRVDVELTPEGPLAHTCKVQGTGCALSGQWDPHYRNGPRNIQELLDEDQPCKKKYAMQQEECDYHSGGYMIPTLCPAEPDSAGECKPMRRYASASDVHTFVAFAISF